MQAVRICSLGFLCQDQQLLIGEPSQISVRNIGNQSDLGAAPRLFAGQVGLQRLLTQAAYAAEQVELVGADPQRRRARRLNG